MEVSTIYLIGQAFGILATVLCIIMTLFKKKWMMLVCSITVNALMMLNFLFIGEVGSAVYLCAVAVVQSTLSLIHTLRNTKVRLPEQIAFSALYIVCGFFGMVSSPAFTWAFTWRNALELLPIIGALLQMAFVFVRDEQRARLFYLCNASVWSVYTAIVGATTFFAEILSVATTAAAMWKYHKKARTETT